MKITIDREVLEQVLNSLERYQVKRQDVRFADEITALQEALAQPQQEPVAVVDDAGVIVVCSYKYKPGDKLYTSPPASTTTSEDARLARKPLTDEEIDRLALDYSLPHSTRSFARAIEAAHGIKETP